MPKESLGVIDVFISAVFGPNDSLRQCRTLQQGCMPLWIHSLSWDINTVCFRINSFRKYSLFQNSLSKKTFCSKILFSKNTVCFRIISFWKYGLFQNPLLKNTACFRVLSQKYIEFQNLLFLKYFCFPSSNLQVHAPLKYAFLKYA